MVHVLVPGVTDANGCCIALERDQISHLQPLVDHISWGDPITLADSLVPMIAAGITTGQRDSDLKPYFRGNTAHVAHCTIHAKALTHTFCFCFCFFAAAALLASTADAHQAARTDRVVTEMLKAITANNLFYTATQNCLILLVRFARLFPVLVPALKAVRCSTPFLPSRSRLAHPLCAQTACRRVGMGRGVAHHQR